jgi:peptide/nickel transport system ATP-binding protein/oligopeptide transport system ATP-binding protein
MSTGLLEVEGLSIALGDPQRRRQVVTDVSFKVAAGEALGIVGESGSGKTLTMLSLLRLLPRAAQVRATRMNFDGIDLLGLSLRELRHIRGRKIAFVFQDPLTALNPVLTVGQQIVEVLRWHFRLSAAAAKGRAVELLARVGIPDPALRLHQYPHQFSGGMRQRVTIAMALAGEPRLLIADEPTTALDVTVQAEIVNLVQRLQREQGLTVIWVTHDLALLARIADRVLVMYAGRVVEEASAARLFASPRHPYAQTLLHSVRHQTSGAVRSKASVSLTAADSEAAGCPFAPRCVQAMEQCRVMAPAYSVLDGDTRIACWAVTAGPAP